MDFTSHPLYQKTQYSNSDRSLNTNTEYSYSNYSTVPSNKKLKTKDILGSVSDLIKDPDYNPWYVSQIKKLGSTRFIELANKARAGSETPAILFKWMLENNTIVK